MFLERDYLLCRKHGLHRLIPLTNEWDEGQARKQAKQPGAQTDSDPPAPTKPPDDFEQQFNQVKESR